MYMCIHTARFLYLENINALGSSKKCLRQIYNHEIAIDKSWALPAAAPAKYKLAKCDLRNPGHFQRRCYLRNLGQIS